MGWEDSLTRQTERPRGFGGSRAIAKRPTAVLRFLLLISVVAVVAISNVWTSAVWIMMPTEVSSETLAEQPEPTKKSSSQQTQELVRRQNAKELPPTFDSIHLDDVMLPPPTLKGGKDVETDWEPQVGYHRYNKDAVFGVAQGLTYDQIVLFVQSLAKQNYTGDLVLCVDFQGMDPKTHYWLVQYLSQTYPSMSVILYHTRYVPTEAGNTTNKLKMVGTASLYRNRTTGVRLPDLREARSLVQMRFEFFWSWLQQYSLQSRIGVFDVADVHFQRHPFEELVSRGLEMSPSDWHVTQEFGSKLGATGGWVQWAWGRDMFLKLEKSAPINPGTSVGGRLAAEVYFRTMVRYFDISGSRGWGEDQAHATVMVYTGYLVNMTTISFRRYRQFNPKNPFSFLGQKALMSGKRKWTNEMGECINNRNATVPIVHKGVPKPCKYATVWKTVWIDEFEAAYSTISTTFN